MRSFRDIQAMMARRRNRVSWPWINVDPDADPPPPAGGGYYGGEDVWHAWMWVDGLNVPTGWTEDASWFLRTTAEAAYFHLGTGQWVYSGAREIHCRCHGYGPSYSWGLARLEGVIEQEGIYAVYDPGSDAFYWYVGNPTRPGQDVYAYCLAEEDTPPITVWSSPWSVPTFQLWPEMPV